MSAARPPPDDAALLEAAGLAATMGRNDPDYVADLEDLSRRLSDVAQAVAVVRLVEGAAGGARIEVGLQRPYHRVEARGAAIGLGNLLEAQVVVVEAPRAGHQHADAGYRQVAQHRHYKDDRP